MIADTVDASISIIRLITHAIVELAKKKIEVQGPI